MVKLWARDAATTSVENLAPEYKDKLKKAAEQAEKDARAVHDASVEATELRDRIKYDRWGECQWFDFSVVQTNKAIERLGKGGLPDFGCPDGTFMTHIDHDDVEGGRYFFVLHTRCCKL